MQCLSCFTSANGSDPSKTRGFRGFGEAVPQAPSWHLGAFKFGSCSPPPSNASRWLQLGSAFGCPCPKLAHAPSVLATVLLAAAHQIAKLAQNVGTVGSSEPWADGKGSLGLQAASLGARDIPQCIRFALAVFIVFYDGFATVARCCCSLAFRNGQNVRDIRQMWLLRACRVASASSSGRLTDLLCLLSSFASLFRNGQTARDCRQI